MQLSKSYRPGTKKAIIAQYQTEIDTYIQNTMVALERLFEEGKITPGQLQVYSIFNNHNYFWLHGGRAWYSDRKEPSRLQGWAYEETTVADFRAHLNVFKEWAARGTAFVQEVQDAHEGVYDIKALIKRLPEGLEAELAKEDDSIPSMEDVVSSIHNFITFTEASIEHSSLEDKHELVHEVNLCRAWLRNYYQAAPTSEV